MQTNYLLHGYFLGCETLQQVCKATKIINNRAQQKRFIRPPQESDVLQGIGKHQEKTLLTPKFLAATTANTSVANTTVSTEIRRQLDVAVIYLNAKTLEGQDGK